jgi:hypothetical protein
MLAMLMTLVVADLDHIPAIANPAALCPIAQATAWPALSSGRLETASSVRGHVRNRTGTL